MTEQNKPKQVTIDLTFDLDTLESFSSHYRERMKDFKDFDDFLISMAYFGMQEDKKRLKRK